MFVMLKSGVMLTIHYNLVTYTRVIKVNLIIINNIDQKFKKKEILNITLPWMSDTEEEVRRYV